MNQNNLKHIVFFFTFFKGLRCNKSSVVTSKKISNVSSRKWKSNFTRIVKTEVKILKILFVRCNSLKFDIPSLKIYLQLTKKRKREKKSHVNYFAIKVIINAKNKYIYIYIPGPSCSKVG